MKVYICKRCGEKFDYAAEAEGRFCDLCSAPLYYHGIEIPFWGEHTMRDYDFFAATN